jgi:hypothetical protein
MRQPAARLYPNGPIGRGTNPSHGPVNGRAYPAVIGRRVDDWHHGGLSDNAFQAARKRRLRMIRHRG